MLTNVKVVLEVKKNGVVDEGASHVWDKLTEKEFLYVERHLLNVMNKMQAFGEQGGHPPGDRTPGVLEFNFTAFNGDKEIAWQGNRWTGIKGAEADFIIGLLKGELASADTNPKVYEKKTKGKRH